MWSYFIIKFSLKLTVYYTYRLFESYRISLYIQELSLFFILTFNTQPRDSSSKIVRTTAKTICICIYTHSGLQNISVVQNADGPLCVISINLHKPNEILAAVRALLHDALVTDKSIRTSAYTPTYQL